MRRVPPLGQERFSLVPPGETPFRHRFPNTGRAEENADITAFLHRSCELDKAGMLFCGDECSIALSRHPQSSDR